MDQTISSVIKSPLKSNPVTDQQMNQLLITCERVGEKKHGAARKDGALKILYSIQNYKYTDTDTVGVHLYFSMILNVTLTFYNDNKGHINALQS